MSIMKGIKKTKNFSTICSKCGLQFPYNKIWLLDKKPYCRPCWHVEIGIEIPDEYKDDKKR